MDLKQGIFSLLIAFLASILAAPAVVFAENDHTNIGCQEDNPSAELKDACELIYNTPRGLQSTSPSLHDHFIFEGHKLISPDITKNDEGRTWVVSQSHAQSVLDISSMGLLENEQKPVWDQVDFSQFVASLIGLKDKNRLTPISPTKQGTFSYTAEVKLRPQPNYQFTFHERVDASMPGPSELQVHVYTTSIDHSGKADSFKNQLAYDHFRAYSLTLDLKWDKGKYLMGISERGEGESKSVADLFYGHTIKEGATKGTIAYLEIGRAKALRAIIETARDEASSAASTAQLQPNPAEGVR